MIESLGISILPLLIGTNKRESLCRLAVFCHLPLRPRSDDACCFGEAWCFVFGGTYELMLNMLSTVGGVIVDVEGGGSGGTSVSLLARRLDRLIGLNNLESLCCFFILCHLVLRSLPESLSSLECFRVIAWYSPSSLVSR